MSIDRRISYKIVLDTETCPLDRDFEGVCPSNMWVYDLSWVVTDKRGNIYEERSFVNADIFLGERELMKSAYYAKKIPEYWERIKKGEMILTSLYNIRKVFLADIELYNISKVYAYNMRFDYGTLNNTQSWETKSKFRYFFPYGIEICDIMKMVDDVIYNTPTYQRFCFENGFVTAHKTPRAQKKAEVLYKYFTREMDFEEEHKGLDDAKIEAMIMARCYAKHKKMREGLREKKA